MEDFGFPVPPAASITDNIATAQAYAATHSPVETMTWFFDQVKAGGPWDYKAGQQNQYEEFGNFHYGAIGASIGIPQGVLDIGAGAQQYYGDNYDPDFGTPWTGYPWGDDPNDQTQINEGVEWAGENGFSAPLIEESFLKDFS